MKAIRSFLEGINPFSKPPEERLIDTFTERANEKAEDEEERAAIAAQRALRQTTTDDGFQNFYSAITNDPRISGHRVHHRTTTTTTTTTEESKELLGHLSRRPPSRKQELLMSRNDQARLDPDYFLTKNPKTREVDWLDPENPLPPSKKAPKKWLYSTEVRKAPKGKKR